MRLYLEKSERASAECSNHLNYGWGALKRDAGKGSSRRTSNVRSEGAHPIRDAASPGVFVQVCVNLGMIREAQPLSTECAVRWHHDREGRAQ